MRILKYAIASGDEPTEMNSKPIVYDLFTGLHGWLEPFLAEGYRCVGYDIVDMCAEIGHPRPDGIELRIRDVRSIHGSELKDATVIVASPPCQEFSYWHQFSWKAPEPRLAIEIFQSCFRIQREAAQSAGRYIPMVVENVVGAQRWVGRSVFHYGSFHLWGDIPPLMPYGSPVKGFKKDMKQTPFSRFSSQSKERKAASAMIAKIPPPLAQHVARTFKHRFAEATA